MRSRWTPFSHPLAAACCAATVLMLALGGVVPAGEPAMDAPPKVLLEWGQRGDGPGEFYSPVCIAIDTHRGNEVVVADLNNSRIQRFDPAGKFLSAFDLPLDKAPRKSCIVGGIACLPEGALLVAFMVQHRIAAYSLDGKVLREWGQKGTGNGEFNQPGGIVIRGNGEVVVADQCNHRIQVFSAEGEYRSQFGGHGSAAGQFGGSEPAGSRFGGPHYLSQDSVGRLFTTEGVMGRIQQLAADGQPLLSWGSKTVEPGAFGEYQFGSLPNTFGPIGVLVDHRNRVWVTSLNDRLQCFTADGRFLFMLEQTDEEHPFLHPHGLAEDTLGNIYLLDSGNQRVVKLGW